MNIPILDTNNAVFYDVLSDVNILENGVLYRLAPESTQINSLVNPEDDIVIKRHVSSSVNDIISLSVPINNTLQTFSVFKVPANYSVTLGLQILSNLTYTSPSNFYVLDGDSKVYCRFFIKLLNEEGDVVSNFEQDPNIPSGISVLLTVPNDQNTNSLVYNNIDGYMSYYTTPSKVNSTFVFDLQKDYEFDLRSQIPKTTASNKDIWIWLGPILACLFFLVAFLLYYYYSTSSSKTIKASYEYSNLDSYKKFF